MRQTLRWVAQFEIAFLGCVVSVTDVEVEKSPLTNQLSPSNLRSAICNEYKQTPGVFILYCGKKGVSQILG